MSHAQLARFELDGATAPDAHSAMVSQLRYPSRVVVDSDFAYFTSYLGLWKVPRFAQNVTLSGGGDAQLLATLQQWDRRLTEITVDTRHVYWTSPVSDYLPARLTRTSIHDGKSVELARLENDDDWPLGIAVDDTDVYFTSNARLLRIPKAGGELEELERIGAHVPYDQIHPTLGIALDERWVYYDAGSELRRLSKADGTSVVLFTVPAGDALGGVVVDEYYVYFGTRSGSIYRSDKAEGLPRVMVTGELNPLVSAVSEDAVYWVEQDASRVRSVTK
jgi:outer membrane protein assembly factor BamB